MMRPKGFSRNFFFDVAMENHHVQYESSRMMPFSIASVGIFKEPTTEELCPQVWSWTPPWPKRPTGRSLRKNLCRGSWLDILLGRTPKKRTVWNLRLFFKLRNVAGETRRIPGIAKWLEDWHDAPSSHSTSHFILDSGYVTFSGWKYMEVS